MALKSLDINSDYSIRQLTTADGLPSNIITAIVKDPKGYVWIATSKGLCRWDGFTAIVFQHDDADSSSLINNHIPRNGLVLDRSKMQLIIGTSSGLSFLDLKNYQFTNYHVDSKNKNALQAGVNIVYLDKQNVLWVGTDQGFCRFDQRQKIFRTFNYTKPIPEGVLLDGNYSNHILDIKQDLYNDSILWITTLAGLLKFEKHTQKFNWFYFPGEDYLRELNQFTMLVPHHDGKLYLGTWNFDMAVFDTRTENFIARLGPGAIGKSKLESQVLPYQIKSRSEIWISSRTGFGVLNTDSDQIKYLQSFERKNGHRFVTELFYADDNYLWLGSEYGVFIMDCTKTHIENYFFDPKDEDHWYLTNCIFEDTVSNKLLIGYGRGEGLHVFDLENRTFSINPYPRRLIKEYNVAEILRLPSGEIVVLSSDEIYKFDTDTKTLIPLNSEYENFPAFTDAKLDSEGNIWVSSSNEGLQKLNLEDATFENVWDWNSLFTKDRKLPMFAEITIDSENRIWFRRRSESYGYYDPVKDTVVYFGNDNKSYDLISFGNVIKDTIWIATAKSGLGFINTLQPHLGVQIKFNVDAIKNKVLHNLVIDDKNQIWSLTEDGLLKINLKNGQIELFDESIGVNIRDAWTNKNAIIPGELKKLSDGTMVIGYRRGLGFFKPDSIDTGQETPTPYLISIEIFNETISPVSNKKPRLSHNENSLTFRFSALDLSNQGIKFRYKLSDIEKDWQKNNYGEKITYANLLPGHYKFIVETIPQSGIGEKKQLSFDFTILPPWWKTVWAILLFILISATILWLVYRFQLRRQIAFRETERLRELDELKTRLYANITHEFRTPITIIMGMAEDLADSMSEHEKQKFRKKLETIERNSSNLLHLVNQMLDLAKLEHGKLNYKPIQTNIIPWLQYIVESHQSMAGSKDIQLTYYSETEKLLMDYDEDQLSKVISNLLTNAIKFTNKGGKVIFHVKHNHIDEQLHLKVKDNGIGIPLTEQVRIFDRFYQVDASAKRNRSGTGIGLSLTREILEMIGGTISVKSQPVKGSEFEVIIPVTQIAPLKSTNPDKFEKPFIKSEISEQAFEEDVEEPAKGNEKPLVLIAEDNHDVAGYVRDTIRMHYKVKWASDGEKAIQMAFDHIPDLVITDLMMPGKDGFEVCNTLKTDERTDHIPVVMLTAKVTDTDRISGYERGADAYLTKPFNKKELMVRLEQLLKLRKQLQTKFSKLDLKSEVGKSISPEEQFILKVAQIVEANTEKSIFNAADLASKVHLSESQLYRKLKAITGKSTAIFIRAVRLKKAKELLESSNLSISEIAYQVGFNDPAWFSRVFKEEFGLSPSEARMKG